MAQKPNIRSIRFSDELAQLIDQQIGDTFTQKFEGLVTRCVWELPQKEAELKRLEQEIKRKRRQLCKMSQQAETLSITINNLLTKATILEDAIDKATQTWL